MQRVLSRPSFARVPRRASSVQHSNMPAVGLRQTVESTCRRAALAGNGPMAYGTTQTCTWRSQTKAVMQDLALTSL